MYKPPPGFEDERLHQLYIAGIRARDKAAEELQKQQIASAQVQNRFYEHLAIFNLSTVALSITFIANSRMSFGHFVYMQAAWVLLLASVLCCAARLWRHDEYILNRKFVEFVEAEERGYKTSAKFFLGVSRPVVGDSSGEQIDPKEAVAKLEERAAEAARAIEKLQGAVKRREYSYKIQQGAALVLAFAGILVLAFWASMNLPQ